MPIGVYDRSKAKPIEKKGKYIICKVCKKAFYVKKSWLKNRRFCSWKCYRIFRKNKPRVNGIMKHGQGYIFVYSPDHPMIINKPYIARSHLVMEKMLGRYLTFNEIVHHKNGIRNDDRPENLQLCANHSEHAKLHYKKRKKNKFNQFIPSV